MADTVNHDLPDDRDPRGAVPRGAVPRGPGGRGPGGRGAAARAAVAHGPVAHGPVAHHAVDPGTAAAPVDRDTLAVDLQTRLARAYLSGNGAEVERVLALINEAQIVLPPKSHAA